MIRSYLNARKIRKRLRNPAVFIENAGGCICTRSVFEGRTPVKWCFRVKSVSPADNGWRFIGRDDSEAYINVAPNNLVLDFNTMANIEPAILLLYDMPVGTDVYLEKRSDGIRFYKTGTKKEVTVEIP